MIDLTIFFKHKKSKVKYPNQSHRVCYFITFAADNRGTSISPDKNAGNFQFSTPTTWHNPDESVVNKKHTGSIVVNPEKKVFRKLSQTILKFELFIASRIFLKSKANFSRPIIRFGILSVALGLSVMLISVAIVTGFQEEIREKVIGFGSHIQVRAFEVNASQESMPISKDQPFLSSLDSIGGIRHFQVFAYKAGIIKTEDQMEGVMLKGIGPDFDWSYFGDKVIAGQNFVSNNDSTLNEVLVSKIIASKLHLTVGDPLRMYFINNQEIRPRGRKFTIAGIYETGLEEFDKLYVLSDIRHIRKLNGWEEDAVGGIEILVKDFNTLEQKGTEVSNLAGYDLQVETIVDVHPQIFDWLSLQDMNVIIILALMVLVAGITMISTLLILILEKTNMIGTLKALGTKNVSIRSIFIINAVYIIGQGLVWGNLFALSLAVLQLKTGIFSLNQASYYVSQVPVNLDVGHILLINIGTLVVCTLMLIIPTYIVTRITPVKAIRFN